MKHYSLIFIQFFCVGTETRAMDPAQTQPVLSQPSPRGYQRETSTPSINASAIGLQGIQVLMSLNKARNCATLSGSAQSMVKDVAHTLITKFLSTAITPELPYYASAIGIEVPHFLDKQRQPTPRLRPLVVTHSYEEFVRSQNIEGWHKLRPISLLVTSETVAQKVHILGRDYQEQKIIHAKLQNFASQK